MYRRRSISPGMLMNLAPSGGLDNPRDCAHDALKLRDLDAQLFLPGGGEGVVAGAAVTGRHSPLGSDPTFQQHALQRGVERAFLHLENIIGGVLNILGNFVTVKFPADGECLEDEQVECARWDFVAVHARLRSTLP